MHPDRRETVAQTCLKNLTIRGVQAKSLYRGAEGVGTSACPNGTRRRCADPNTIRDGRAGGPARARHLGRPREHAPVISTRSCLSPSSRKASTPRAVEQAGMTSVRRRAWGSS